MGSEITSKHLDEWEKGNKQFTGVKREEINVGDYVRISGKKTAFSKSYKGNFTREIFKVVSKKVRPSDAEVTLYKLEDLLGEEVEGFFLRKDLSKTSLPSKPVVEKVVRKDKKRGSLVKLRDYPIEHRVWVDSKKAKHYSF